MLRRENYSKKKMSKKKKFLIKFVFLPFMTFNMLLVDYCCYYYYIVIVFAIAIAIFIVIVILIVIFASMPVICALRRFLLCLFLALQNNF